MVKVLNHIVTSCIITDVNVNEYSILRCESVINLHLYAHRHYLIESIRILLEDKMSFYHRLSCRLHNQWFCTLLL